MEPCKYLKAYLVYDWVQATEVFHLAVNETLAIHTIECIYQV